MDNKKYDIDLLELHDSLPETDSLDKTEYDLKYDWIPDNESYIVICGDIIDPIKRHVCKK